MGKKYQIISLIVFTLWGLPLGAENIPEEVTPYVQLGHMVKVSIYKNPTVNVKARKIINNGELVQERIEETPVGSGTIISPDGLILTNSHVYFMNNVYRYDNRINRLYVRTRVSNYMLVYRLKDNDPLKAPEIQYLAAPVSVDKTHDTALLKIYAESKGKKIKPNDFPYCPFGNPYSIKLNETITIIGYPAKGGDTITITEGKFLGFYRNRNFSGLDGFIKSDAAMSSGNSGGAALYRNEIVGVPTAVTPPALAGSDMGYINPVTWAIKALTIARNKYEFNTQEIPQKWVLNDYNTDETRHHIYLTGWIVSSHSRHPLEAEILMTRSDRSLEQIQSLHLELQRYIRIRTIQAMHTEGTNPKDIAGKLNMKTEDVEKIIAMKPSKITFHPDVQLYTRGEFFYGVTRCDDKGFFILDVPRNRNVKFYAFADQHRTMIRTLDSGDGISKDLGKFVVFKY